MTGPQAPPRAFTSACERNSHKRCARQIEAFRPVALHKRSPLDGAVRAAVPPVEYGDLQGHLGKNYLNRKVELLPEEASPQDRVALDRLLPSQPEQADLQIAGEQAIQLLTERAWRCRRQHME